MPNSPGHFSALEAGMSIRRLAIGVAAIVVVALGGAVLSLITGLHPMAIGVLFGLMFSGFISDYLVSR